MEHTRKTAYLRAFPTRKKNEEYSQAKKKNWKESKLILILDTETTADEFQSLRFGSFQVRQGEHLIHKGVFYDQDNVDNSEISLLRLHCKSNGISLYTLEEFVDIFYNTVYHLGATCIGFNLPFDLSRIAIRWNGGRHKNYGTYTVNNNDKFLFTLTKNENLPGIRVTHADSTRSFISFARSRIKRVKGFDGKFLDLKTLASILLHNKGITLDRACERYKLPRKHEIKQHGVVSHKYIDYNLNDVEMTFQLYIKLRKEYEKFNLDLTMPEVYTEASLGKQLLRQMGVMNFDSKNPDFPKELIGKGMSAYYGGRTECRYRKKPARVTVLDFKSQYPSTFSLMGLWRFMVAEKVGYEEYTELTRDIVNKTTLESLTDRKVWENMMILCEVEPEEDILPLRSNYHPTLRATTIGLNHVTSERPMWYAIGDVLASKILTGKSPKIKKAIRFIPIGTQQGLKPVNILGATIDPSRDAIQQLIEKRFEYIKKAKTDEAYEPLQMALKTLANATSYGIFIEMNLINKSSEVITYSDIVFNSHMDHFEEKGKFFNPIIPVHQIAGSRLLMAMAEAWIAKHKKKLYYLDTDSLFVTPDCAKDLQDFFQPLYPYNTHGKLLEIKKEKIWFYGISSKRYVLYYLKGGKIVIEKDDYRLHGLGHLQNPFNDKADWHIEVWKDILDLHYGRVSVLDLIEKYTHSYAIGKMGVSTPEMFKRFRVINRMNPKNKQIRPFNFFLYGQCAEKRRNKLVRPIAPYRNKHIQQAVYEKFIDYTTGKELIGEEYWFPLSQVFLDYIKHPESKFENGNDEGWMRRRNLTVEGIKYIGKEVRTMEPSVVDELPQGLEPL